MPWRVNRISREPDSICAGAACTLAPAAAGGAGSAGNGPEGALHGGKDFVLGWEEVAPWAWHDEASQHGPVEMLSPESLDWEAADLAFWEPACASWLAPLPRS